MSQTLTIKSGFTCCTACLIAARPQEERMAVPTSDGRALCLNCGRISSDFPQRFLLVPGLELVPTSVRELLALVTSNPSNKTDSPFIPVYEIRNIVHKDLDLSGEQGADRAAYAVAQGNAHVLIEEADRVEILLAFGKHSFHTMRISFLPDELEAANLADFVDESASCSTLVGRLGDLEKKAVLELASRGFRFHHFDDSGASLRRALLFKGPSVQSGLKVELNWILA